MQDGIGDDLVDRQHEAVQAIAERSAIEPRRDLVAHHGDLVAAERAVQQGETGSIRICTRRCTVRRLPARSRTQHIVVDSFLHRRAAYAVYRLRGSREIPRNFSEEVGQGSEDLRVEHASWVPTKPKSRIQP
nr:hypothetical protein GCM10020092_103680 [Actinoplanes digitatis]